MTHFALHSVEIEELIQSEGFCVLSRYLAQLPQVVCNSHSQHEFRPEDILVRDVLHALLAPLVELFNRAVFVAEQATKATNLEDYEYAFHGDGRAAFLWLQSFLDDERKWCLTHGCPSCVASRTLDSEFHIRLVAAACLLSETHAAHEHSSTDLPSLMFFLRPLRAAMASDELWGDFLENSWSKVIVLRHNIEDLMRQVAGLDAVLSDEYDAVSREIAKPLKVSSFLPAMRDVPRTKLKRSKLAKRQLKILREGVEMTMDILSNLPQDVEPQDRSCLPEVYRL